MKILNIKKSDIKKIATIFIREVGLFVVFVFILFFDGTYFSKNILDIQLAFNLFMSLAFCIMFYRATKKIREFMIYAIILGFFGEHLFSKILQMYTYRLENVPFYVPLGHAVLYARVLRFSKSLIVKKNNKAIEELFSYIIILLATCYLLLYNDVFGFVMTFFVFLLLWKRPKERLYFYTMYILVAILEIGGTAFGAWYWPKIAFSKFNFLPSNNPPSGISLFYFLLDVSCFLIYILVNKNSWNRFKRVEARKKLN